MSAVETSPVISPSALSVCRTRGAIRSSGWFSLLAVMASIIEFGMKFFVKKNCVFCSCCPNGYDDDILSHLYGKAK
ncbi:MAG: hypothetical protein Ta2B_30120 [Termitinemataceae bacterium]|nr:MAG: hypothetical protein Ta2B_30120 [Termitinemataceae bacterium]